MQVMQRMSAQWAWLDAAHDARGGTLNPLQTFAS
jgi:hypothetical protein